MAIVLWFMCLKFKFVCLIHLGMLECFMIRETKSPGGFQGLCSAAALGFLAIGHVLWNHRISFNVGFAGPQ